MGLIANIFKWDLADCSNGGLSSYASEVTVVNVDGPFEAKGDRPAVLLLAGNMEGTLKIVGAVKRRVCVSCGMTADEASAAHESLCSQDGLVSGHSFQDRWVKRKGQEMMGGAYVATSDSRFSEACETLLGHRFYGAVALHDRYE